MKMATAKAPAPSSYEGLQTGLEGDTLLVRIPRIVSKDHCVSVTTELCRIDPERPGVSKWNVDLSEITDVPFFLAGALGRLRNELNGLGCEVRFLNTKVAG